VSLALANLICPILFIKLLMRVSTPAHNPPNVKHTQSASVPLSVYRHLAAELQATEARLNSLNAQNQQLATENQHLRQEIEKTVQSVLQLQQSVDSGGVVSRRYAQNSNNFRAEAKRPGSESLPMPESVVVSLPTREAGLEKVFTEQESVRYRRRFSADRPKMSGRWLAIAILLTMVTAFGAGYLIMRPLLPNR
jgi:hypothetical protein